ncbi:MAG: 3-dehydroquinate synthase [Tissierellia bacterium]|nr:3-dehydroquinate synthase [Tissierellia bacterium]
MRAIIREIIDINLSTNYEYIIGEHLLQNLRYHMGIRHDQKIMIISDEVVWNIYGDMIDSSFKDVNNKVCRTILKPGEDQKNLENLTMILENLANERFIHSDVILAIGGGVIGDISGLAAGLYMRGISHVYVPTTTLAAIDSSVGGKTAVNLTHGKNMVGLFKQPSRVLCDVSAFETLSDRIFNEGIAEAIKIGFIYDIKILPLLSESLREDKSRLIEVIKRAVRAKYRVVQQDEYDKSIRHILNYGHTLAHAIEQKSNYELRHGEAVSIGLMFMTELSERLGYVKKSENFRYILENFGDISATQLLKNLLDIHNLPTTTIYKYDDLESFFMVDKKQNLDSIDLVLLEEIGKATIKNVLLKDLRGFLQIDEN